MRLLTLCFLFALFTACSPSEKADYIFWNGKIYTMQSGLSTVEVLGTRGEKIIFAGSRKDADKYMDKKTRAIDLQGRILLPGFTDAHVHPLSGGLGLLGCNLTGIESPDSVLATIKRYAEAHSEKEWIKADNFWLPVFPGGNPKKELLDAIIPNRPVYVTSSDGHSAWVNSKALELAGITAETADPVNGRIERDARTKAPTGTLREDAMGLVGSLLPKPTPEELANGLREGLKMASSLGITNIVEASAGEDFIKTYLALAENGELTAHVNISIFGDVAKGREGVQKVLELNQKYAPKAHNDVRFNQVKLFMDGVVEGKTAAMISPYHNDVHKGIANASPEVAGQVIEALDKAGLQIHVHAIGDQAIRQTLDAFENARKVNGIRDSRHHIAHLHVIHPDDWPRFKALDVVPNFQALWATLEDTYMTDLNFPFLGPERLEWQYPIGSIARTGAKLAFGSDWDVSTMDPFDAMQVAVTRRGPDSLAREPWTPQHLVDVQSVVEGYTKTGAWLTFREAECGTLEVGKLADLILLDRDIFEIPKNELYQTQVDMTMFRGFIVYAR
jgi:hypothetical protein